MYALGIDLGTTYTAAATWRDGHVEIASLGSRAATIPSVVLLREDEQILTGESAHRRGVTEPHRVSREFKRRIGDPTPILLGGVPYSAEALMSQLLRWVVDEIAQREGGEPERLCISHPANWGPYKQDLLSQAVRLANIDQPVRYTTEPEAAAVFYAHQQRVEPGALVAVYDLGGGTFDAAVLRKSADGFEILGQPEGIERLGGIDFDAAVFNHVRQALGGKLEELDDEDPATLAAVARLKEECIAAKEALSTDTDTSIPVLLPNLATEVRLTRAEFEAMVRPTLHSTIEALQRALRSAGVTADQLHSVLLVGGSSRIPLVSQLVGAELGRPVAVDAHPKHAIALGAALLAAGVTPQQPSADAVPPPESSSSFVGSASVPTGGAETAAPVQPGPPVPPEPTPAPSAPAADVPPTAVLPPIGVASPPPPKRDHDPDDVAPPADPYPSGAGRSPGRFALLVAGAVLLVLLGGGMAVWALRHGGDDPVDPDALGGNTQTSPPASSSATNAAPEETAGTEEEARHPSPSQEPADQVPPGEQCTDQIRSNTRWVCLTSAEMQPDGSLVIQYEAEWNGDIPNINGGYHLHIYGSDGSNPPDEIMGVHSPSAGSWVIKDENPAILSADQVAEVIGDHPLVCARIADSRHWLTQDTHGGYTTGNCITIRR